MTIENDQMLPENKKEKGASMVEYILLVALIAVVAIAAMQLMGQTISSKFSTTASTITNAS